MKKRIYLLLVIGLTSFSMNAQEVFSLKDCIEKGLERNYSIRIIRNEQKISENNAIPGNAGYLPTFELNGGVNGTIYDTENNLRAGGTEKTTGQNAEAADIGVNMSWTIFDGFGIQATYERLKELERMGELNTRMTIEDFVAQLSAEYFNLIRQNIRLHNLRASLVLSKERMRIVEQSYYIGSMSRLDLQQAQVDFNADSSNVLNQLEIVHRTRISLNELMALDNVEEQIQIRDTTISPNSFLDEVDIWKNTLAANSSLLIAQKNKTLSGLDYKRAKSRNYPYVRLNAGYGYTANWYEAGTTELQKRLGLNYGVTLGFTLFDGLNRRREQRNARLEIENRNLQAQELELSLRADLSTLWMAYKNNLGLWALEKENVIVAQEYYNVAIDRYRLRELSGIELREAQNQLLDAEERRSIAEYNTKLCEISLLQLSGQIIPYFTADPENTSD